MLSISYLKNIQYYSFRENKSLSKMKALILKFLGKIRSKFLGKIRSIICKRQKVLDLREGVNDARAANYLGHFLPTVVNVDCEKIRFFPFNQPCVQTAHHPFVRALKKFSNINTTSANDIRDELERFYTLCQPAVAQQLMTSLSSQFLDQDLPPYTFTAPWSDATGNDYLKLIPKVVMRENKKRGGAAVGIEHGWAFCGPVSKVKLNIEMKALTSIYESIQQKGYAPDISNQDGDIKVTCFIVQNNDELVYQVVSGIHRLSTLVVLGKKLIRVRVVGIIRREEVDLWPGVLKGRWTTESALNAFDDVYYGRSPAILNNYIDYARSDPV